MAYWHIRMKDGQNDRAEELWGRDTVGVWLTGGLTGLEEAEIENGAAQAIARRLRDDDLNGGSTRTVTVNDVNTARRFRDQIHTDDWVYTCFGAAVHIAQVDSEARAGARDRDNHEMEQFIYREIRNANSFALGPPLPDCFRLLSSQQSTLCHPIAFLPQVEMLVASDNEADVQERFRQLSFDEWLNMLGPHGWESFCEGYLILEEGFVPTGLVVGKTLPGLDIIGKNRDDRHAIYAQCKKNPQNEPLDLQAFHESIQNLPAEVQVFLFAYGGCPDGVDHRVTVLTRDEIVDWLTDTKNGRLYAELLGIDPRSAAASA